MSWCINQIKTDQSNDHACTIIIIDWLIHHDLNQFIHSTLTLLSYTQTKKWTHTHTHTHALQNNTYPEWNIYTALLGNELEDTTVSRSIVRSIPNVEQHGIDNVQANEFIQCGCRQYDYSNRWLVSKQQHAHSASRPTTKSKIVERAIHILLPPSSIPGLLQNAPVYTRYCRSKWSTLDPWKNILSSSFCVFLLLQAYKNNFIPEIAMFSEGQSENRRQAEMYPSTSICSVGVSCSVAIAATRVRIPADAFWETLLVCSGKTSEHKFLIQLIGLAIVLSPKYSITHNFIILPIPLSRRPTIVL